MQQEQTPLQSDPVFSNGFSLPALQVPKKHYSLEADILTGWQPKMKVVGPVPLNFDASVCDQLVENLTSFGTKHSERVVYLGPRYPSSFKLHQQMRRQYTYKYESIINTNFPHLAAYFRKFYSHFKPKHTRPFTGMNPTLKPHQSVLFDAGFQSANLDAAIRVAPNEYDLFIRVDSNTRGHLQWFNFTVQGRGCCKKVKLNIVNCRKGRTLYNCGMKPYFLSSVHPHQGWKQGGNKVKYEQKVLRYSVLKNTFPEERLQFNCLSFQYQFENEEQVVQFAYCPPFTYSDNVQMITSIQENLATHGISEILKEEVVGQTLGGLQMSLLTITDPSLSNHLKQCVVVSARIHPGQTCGSYMVKGFLQFITSTDPLAEQLRKKIVFKVIPMLNPDGVVTGNFRTSLCGRDLNRMFKTHQSLLIPQVVALKSLVASLKAQFKSRLQFFLDFHGHSVRKNVFIYGPQYQIWESNYYRTRILPKLISEKTEMFRYYSCIFRISAQKKSTARAVLMKHVPHCYTIEASVGSYYFASQKKDYDFVPHRWQLMGQLVVQSMNDYLKMMQENQATRLRQTENKQICLPRVRISGSKTRKKFSQGHNKSQMEAVRKQKPQIQKAKRVQKDVFDNQADEEFPAEAIQMINALKEAQKGKKAHEQHYQEGGSDSEGSQDDLSEKQMSVLHHQILLSLKQFKERFYNRGQKRIKSFIQSSVHIPPKKLQMIPSLRKKAELTSVARSQLSSQRLGQKSPGASKIWVRGQSTRRSSGHPISESQSFHVYVAKHKVNKEEEEQSCRMAYFSPRRKIGYN